LGRKVLKLNPYALTLGKAHNRYALGVLAAIVAWAVAGYLIILVQGPLVEAVPTLRGYNFIDRIGKLSMGIIPFAGGLGIHALINRNVDSFFSFRARKAMAVCAAIVLVLVVMNQKLVALYAWVSQGNMVMNYESPQIENLAKRINENPWPVRTESFQMYPAYLHPYGIETGGGLQPMYPRRYYEFWGTMLEPGLSPAPQGRPFTAAQLMLNAEPTVQKKHTGTLYQLIFRNSLLMSHDNHQYEGRNIGGLYQLNMLSLANIGYVVSRDRLLDPSLKAIIESSVSWISLSVAEKILHNIKGNFTGRQNLFIYENRDVLPRFFSLQNIRKFDRDQDVLEAIATASIKQLRTTLFINKDDLPPVLQEVASFQPAEISLESYQSDEIHLSVLGTGQILLFVGNNFSPYWSAYVDEVVVPIFPANHAFWGVVLPKGAKKIGGCPR